MKQYIIALYLSLAFVPCFAQPEPDIETLEVIKTIEVTLDLYHDIEQCSVGHAIEDCCNQILRDIGTVCDAASESINHLHTENTPSRNVAITQEAIEKLHDLAAACNEHAPLAHKHITCTFNVEDDQLTLSIWCHHAHNTLEYWQSIADIVHTAAQTVMRAMVPTVQQQQLMKRSTT